MIFKNATASLEAEEIDQTRGSAPNPGLGGTNSKRPVALEDGPNLKEDFASTSH